MLALLSPPLLQAQTPVRLPAGALLQLQVPQPPVDVSSPVTAEAVFDPSVARVGESVFYQVSINAAEASIQWPGTISAPPELKFGPAGQGQLMEYFMNKFRPFTSFLYKVRATATGHFTVPDFVVKVGGQPVEIPAATLDVDNATSGPPAQHLVLEIT